MKRLLILLVAIAALSLTASSALADHKRPPVNYGGCVSPYYSPYRSFNRGFSPYQSFYGRPAYFRYGSGIGIHGKSFSIHFRF